MSDAPPRRLAAIVSTDVVGYSAMVGRDEAGTLARLARMHSDIATPAIASNGGRIVKSMGDGLLLEFTSVVDATRAALEMQQAAAAHNADIAAAERIVFRIGINQGDIVIDGDDILGDGVNVAARLQEIAPEGGLAIAGRVHEDVRDRLDAMFEDAGECELKNIARPIRVWTWQPEQVRVPAAAASEDIVGERPSIAILPFDDMSSVGEEDFFADAIAEDVIAALSKFRWFFVIARNSSFVYRGGAVDTAQVARELGVRYLLEGSVRRAGARIRVTAQLIDAPTGRHVWAERYDRRLDDVFALQDEITECIVGALAPEVLATEARRAECKPPESLDPWECLVRGNQQLWRLTNEGWGKGEELLRYALALVAMFERQPEAALTSLDEVVRINPNMAMAHGTRAMVLSFEDRHEEAMRAADTALALSPRDPARGFWIRAHSAAAFKEARYEDCIDWTRHGMQATPGANAGAATLTASLALAGRIDEANALVHETLKSHPQWCLS